MLYVLLHRMKSLAPPQIQMKALDMVKNRSQMTPGVKELASYSTIGYQGAICVVETDKLDNLVPFTNALSGVGIDTQIIPVSKIDEALKKWEENLKEAMKQSS